MSNLLRDGAVWLARMQAAACRDLVTLRRGDAATADVPVLWGATKAVIENCDGSFQEVRSRDAIVRRTDYVIDGRAVAPRPGDRLEQTDDELTYRYEVGPFAGEPSDRESDAYHRQWRIHVREISRFEAALLAAPGVRLLQGDGDLLLLIEA